jgi:Protein of unknown function (DUF4238)
MNQKNENQHYVSRVLLKRFKKRGMPLECYQIQTEDWVSRSIDKICASRGYNQLLISGSADNTLEDVCSKVESRLPETLKALANLGTNPNAELAPLFYNNLLQYLAILKLSSIPSKALAVANFVFQINFELEHEKYSLLRDLEIPRETIAVWKQQHQAGLKIIVESDNALQLFYRSQFARVYSGEVSTFSTTKWLISRSPLELPISDVGLVPLTCTGYNHYFLPIGNDLLLQGILWHDVKKNVFRAPIKGLNLTHAEAEYSFDLICASAVNEIMCSHRIEGISDGIRRAKTKGIGFVKLMNLPEAASAGMRNVQEGLRFRAVRSDEFVKFIHSFGRPPAS